MADLADIYDQLRTEISTTVAGLSEADLDRHVPATPVWTIRDIVSHLTGDAVSLLGGDFPREFFESFGDATAVVALNEWTQEHVSSRDDLPLETVLKEWDEAAATLMGMFRGESELPQGIPPFADRVLITDLTVHQQDIYGALGVQKDRDAAPIRIAIAGYIAIIGLRLNNDGIPPLRIEIEDKTYTAGGDEPDVTVKTTRFELFRALSGRRSPDQIKAYDWNGDSEPYLKYFFPYGVRADALVE